MPTVHGFCSLHRIAYNRTLDPHCPQCLIGHVQGAAQLDYEPPQAVTTQHTGGVLDPATGAQLDAITLQPVK